MSEAPDIEVICDYCSAKATFLKTSETVYHGRDYGPLWICEPCQAWVGCHPDLRPLGRLADSELRQAKRDAHLQFDRLWKDWAFAYPDLGRCNARLKRLMRARAYAWATDAMNIPADKCHIGQFNVEQCNQLIDLINDNHMTSAKVRALYSQKVIYDGDKIIRV